jgi:hypothetical protein
MFYAVKNASCERQGVKSGRSAADQACCKKPDERQPKPPTWRVSSFAFVSLAFFLSDSFCLFLSSLQAAAVGVGPCSFGGIFLSSRVPCAMQAAGGRTGARRCVVM